MALYDYIKSLKSLFHKDELMEQVRMDLTELKDLRSIVKNYGEYFDEFKSELTPTAIGINEEFISLMPEHHSGNLFEIISSVFPTILTNAEYIYKHVHEDTQPNIITEGLTARNAILLRSNEQLSFFTEYLSKFCNYFSDIMLSTEEGSEIEFSTAQIKEINNGFNEFIKAFEVLSDHEFINKVLEVPNVVMMDKTGDNENPALGLVNSTKLDPFNSTIMKGFIGNPIYRLRSIKNTYTVNKYKAMKQRKQLMEIKLQYLKEKAAGNENPALEKKIKNMQEYINGLEYSIAKMEE